MERQEIKEQAKSILKERWKEVAIAMLIYGAIICLASWILAFIPIIGSLVWAIISVVITYNLLIYFVKFKRGESASGLDIITTIPQNFKAALAVVWGIFCKIWYYVVASIVCMIISISVAVVGVSNSIQSIFDGGSSFSMGPLAIIFMIACIALGIVAAIKALFYVLSQYIMNDSGNTLKGKEAVAKSAELMQNLRLKYFVLALSFIGWYIVVGIIGSILVYIFGKIGWPPLTEFVMFMPVAAVLAYWQVSMVIFYDDLVGKNKIETVKKDDEPEVVEEQ